MIDPDDAARSALHAATRAAWSRMSEVDLLLALAETGDLLDLYGDLEEHGKEVADAYARTCAQLTDIEDELMERGFSPAIFLS